MPWPARHLELFVGLVWVALLCGVGLSAIGLLALAWGGWRKRWRPALAGLLLGALGCLSIWLAMGQREQVQLLTTCRSHVSDIAGGLEYFQQGNGRFPPDVATLIPDYLPTLPTCPSSGQDTYSASYTTSVDGTMFTVACGGAHHVVGGVPLLDLPRYGSPDGLQP